MVLSDVEEVVTTIDVDEDTFEEIIRVRTGCRCRAALLMSNGMPIGRLRSVRWSSYSLEETASFSCHRRFELHETHGNKPAVS